MIKIVFFGTPEIAVPSLEYLIEKSDIKILGVVTKIDKPKGRGQKLEHSPVKIAAMKHNIEVFQPKLIRKDEELIAKLKDLKPDFFVTFAYGQILSQEILDIPKHGTINLHASLLPKYRGANPIQHAIVNGDNLTGITTMMTVVELDAGDVCLKREIDICEDMNDIELRENIAKCAPDLLYCSIKGLADKSICPVPQEMCDITVAGKFQKEDACIDWSKSAKEIHNLIRGLCSWPCCHTFFNDKNIKILKSKVVNKFTDLPPGSLIQKIAKKTILIRIDKNKIPDFTSKKELSNWVKDEFKKLGTVRIEETGINLKLSSKSADRETIKRRASKEENKAVFAKFENIITKATKIDERKASEKHTKDQEIYYNQFRIGDNDFEVHIFVDKPNKKDKDYLYAGHNATKTVITSRDTQDHKESLHAKEAINNIITDFKQNFNPIPKNKEGLEIATGDGVLMIITVKPEGKGEMRAVDWINGSKMQVGDKFVCKPNICRVGNCPPP